MEGVARAPTRKGGADSRQEVEREIRAGIAGYLEFMVQEGHAVPPQMAHDAGMVSVELPSVVAP